MDYYPRNEGEQANYIFTFNLATTYLNTYHDTFRPSV